MEEGGSGERLHKRGKWDGGGGPELRLSKIEEERGGRREGEG